MPATQVPTAAKVRELERELGLRRNYYPRAIANGNLKQQDADYRIEVLESILADYRERLRQDQKPAP